MDLKQAIEDVMNRHFRTEHDTGANSNALLVLNCFRVHAGMERINVTDLPQWDGKNYVCPKTGNKV